MSSDLLPIQVEALVVGAGPVGLAAAITLKQLGIDVAIVDKDVINRNGSRSAVVHSRTLEVLDTIGMSKPIIEEGIKLKKLTFYGGTNELLGLRFQTLLKGLTAYPFSVLISQEHVENLLREKLHNMGLTVVHNKSASSYSYDEGSKTIIVTFEDGTSVRTQYLVGTDGARSLIRNQSHIPFADPYTGVAYDDNSASAQSFSIALADVILEEPLPPKFSEDGPSIHLDKFFMYIPLNSKDPKRIMWRIAFGYPSSVAGNIPQGPGIEFLQEQMDKRNPWPEKIIIEKVLASSRYRVRSALADTFWTKVGNGDILLAGDAAHVHSPIGGQGMNLGLCDAVALAQAIHAHRDSRRAGVPIPQADEILKNYADERRRIGHNVIGLTKRLTLMVNNGVGWRRVVRNMLMRVIGRLPGFKKRMSWRISGLINRPA